jgi:GTP-binding protein EngB required for normal cell division
MVKNAFLPIRNNNYAHVSLYFYKILAVTDPVPTSAIMAYQKMDKIKQNKTKKNTEQKPKEVEKKPKVYQPFIFGDDDFQDPYGNKKKHSKTL